MRGLIERWPAAAALLLGAAAACGFAPLSLWPLTIAALAGWLALVHAAPSLRSALWRSWTFGVGHFTINNNWIAHAFDFQDAMPAQLGYLAPVLLALYLAVFPMLAGGLAWRARSRAPDAAFVLVAAAAWIVTEWLRSRLFTGYAWDPLGVAWLPAGGIAGAARFVGTYALSGLMVLSAGALLLAIRRRWRLPAGVAATLVLLALFGRPALPPPAPDAPLVRIVQPGIGQDARGEQDTEPMIRTLTRLSGKPGKRRVIFWPEGVIRPFVEDGYPPYIYTWQGTTGMTVRRRLAARLGPDDTLLFGGNALQFDRDDRIVSATNSVFGLDWNARVTGRYDKAHLVPYGEYLPMRPLLSAIGLARLVPGDIDFAPGPGARALEVAGIGPVGIQVCYEIIFSGAVVDPKRRPRLIFNPSTDAWFGAWGPPQHLAQARMRAIEEGLPVIRSTPTGISAAIGADGSLLASLGMERAAAVELPLPAPAAPTLFSRAGNAMAFVVAALFVAAAIALRRRSR